MSGNAGIKPALKEQIELDWERARRRIADASVALDRLEDVAPEVVEQIWMRRAERLAQVLVKPDEGEQIQLVVLRLGREVYGLDVQYVFDIRPVERITRVPRVPDWVAGVVNLRGRIFSVVDLQRFLGLAQGDAGDATRYLIVVETPEMQLALLADEVLPLEVVSDSRIQDAAGIIRGIRPEYVRGIAERGNGDSLVVLDLPALLGDKQLSIHEEIL
jgi:purine-binding chemotaxis protein CheW